MVSERLEEKSKTVELTPALFVTILITLRGFSNLCLSKKNVGLSPIYDVRMTAESSTNTEFSRARFQNLGTYSMLTPYIVSLYTHILYVSSHEVVYTTAWKYV